MTSLRERWVASGRLWADSRVADVLLAAVVLAAQLFGTFAAAQNQPDRRGLDVLAVLLLSAGAIALVARRRHPVAVLFVVCAATFAYELRDHPEGPVWAAGVVAFFTAYLAGHRVVSLLAILLGWTSLWWQPLLTDRAVPSAGEAVAFAAWMLVLVGVAEAVRMRRAFLEETRRRAEDAAAAREEEARRRRSEERLRIARELHDVLAHNISLINVQAGTALYLLDDVPGHDARPALSAIKQASGDALGELRSVLDALRAEPGASTRAPAPRLSQLGELTAQATAAGLDVRTEVEGEARPLPATVELAAFRICQEAMTNVIRHAGASRARVRVEYGRRELVVEVDDDGRGGAAPLDGAGAAGGGNGLPGMRERTAALGGSLEAGAKPEGGFRVRARLPLEAAA